MRRKAILSTTIVLVLAGVGSAQSSAPSNRPGCSTLYSVGDYIAYGRTVMPTPTKGQASKLAVMERCQFRKGRRKTVRRWRARHELRLGRHVYAESTAYSACDSGSTTAAGTGTFFGEVAQNSLSLGTRIYMDRPVHGRRLFVVLDRIGSGSELDFFMPCGWVDSWGRRTVGYRVVL